MWVLIMCQSDPQPLHPGVLAVLESLLEHDFRGRPELQSQLIGVLGKSIDEDGSLRLFVKDEPPAPVARRIPTEGTYVDADGVRVHVLLHVVDGYLDELEVYREDSGRVLTRLESVPSLDTSNPW